MKLTPLAIVKRTPMSNCGSCGYPTCLAFGAAVVKTALPLRRCPFIDLTGLSLDSAPLTPLADQEARDLAFIATLKEKIAPFDLQGLAAQLGATWSPDAGGTLSFRYLGQEVTLSKTTLLVDGREPDDHRDQILIYNYIGGRGDRRPDGEWIGMESLSYLDLESLVFTSERLAERLTLLVNR